MVKQIYKVSCEFYVKAESKAEVIGELSWENDFLIQHVIVEPSKLPKNEELWEDYTEKLK